MVGAGVGAGVGPSSLRTRGRTMPRTTPVNEMKAPTQATMILKQLGRLSSWLGSGWPKLKIVQLQT